MKNHALIRPINKKTKKKSCSGQDSVISRIFFIFFAHSLS